MRVRKAKNGLSASGLLISDSGNLQVPFSRENKVLDYTVKSVFDCPIAKVGNKVTFWSRSFITKSNTGVIVEIFEQSYPWIDEDGVEHDDKEIKAKIKSIDGKLEVDDLREAFVLNEAQYEEIVNYFESKDKK